MVALHSTCHGQVEADWCWNWQLPTEGLVSLHPGWHLPAGGSQQVQLRRLVHEGQQNLEWKEQGSLPFSQLLFSGEFLDCFSNVFHYYMNPKALPKLGAGA